MYSKKCGISSSTPDYCREGIEENQQYCEPSQYGCKKKDKRTYSKIIEEIRKGVVVENKPKSIVVENKPKSIVVEAKPKSIVVENKPKSIVVEAKPKSIVVENKPKSKPIVVETKPKPIVVENKPKSKSIVVEDKPIKKCGINSLAPDYCREGIEENQQYCEPSQYGCKKKSTEKRTYDKIIEEIRKGVVVENKPIGESKAKPIVEAKPKSIVVEAKSKSIVVEAKPKPIVVEAKPKPIVVEAKPKSIGDAKNPMRILTKDQDRSQALERHSFDNFRIYNLENDFERLSEKPLGKGGFGATYRTKFKSTGQPVILKKFLNYDAYGVIDNDIIKEIALLQFLNQFPNTKVVNFYGVAFNSTKENIYLVLQPLEKTLDSLWFQTIPPEQIRIIFYQILKAFSNIHGAGVIHNDIKIINLMLNGEDIRVIDFGLAEYLGVGPSTSLINNYSCTELTKAPDSFDQGSYGFIGTNRKTYASDMYSIGASMIHLIVGKWLKFRVENNKIFTVDTLTKKDITNITDKLNISEKLGSQGYDLLLKIMNPDTHQRWCALEALQHPYFSEMHGYIPIDRSIIRGGSLEKYYNGQVHYTEEEYLKHQMELCYLEIQHQTFMDDQIKMFKLDTEPDNIMHYFTTIDWLMNVYVATEIINGLDALVNCLQIINVNWENVTNKKGTAQIQLLTIISNHIACSIFNFNQIDIYDYRKISDNSFTYNDAKEFIKNVFILDNNAKLPITPISIHVQYIFLKLKFELKDPRINAVLEQLYIGISLHIVFWFMQPEPFEGMITTWELAVFSAIQSLSIILKMSPQDLNKKPIISFLSIEDHKFANISQYFYKQMNDKIIQDMFSKSEAFFLKRDFYKNSKYFFF